MNEEVTLDEFTGDNEGMISAEPQGVRLAIDESYPKEWGFAELEEVCEVNSGFTWNKEQETDSSENGAVPVIKIGNVQDSYLDLDDILYLTGVSDEDLKENKARKDWLLMIGSNGSGERVGHCGIIEKDMEFVYASFLYGLHADSEHLLPRFLFYSLNRPKVQQRLTSFTAGSTSLKNLNKSTIENLTIPTPPLPEQRKIATVLFTVDRAIGKTEEIESQVRRTQNGIVQETLKCGLRGSDISDTGTKLGEIPTHWELTSIGEIVADEEHSFTDGARYALSSAEIHEEGEARAILLQEVGEGEFNDEDPKFATGEKYEEITHRAIYPGEVVVAKMAEPVARACIVPDNYDKYLLGCADVVRIQTNDEFDSRFLMYCMNSHKVWRQAVAHLRGTGRSRINLENIAELKLPKPPLDEQIEIADALQTFDDRIQTERECRESLQRLKHGLMQDLLSGTVRTTDTNIQVPNKIA